ncbi:MAG: hypothetical protein K9M94_11690 [Spirochaetia bacterium]|nr:hypothetical protein [Spirochaetia bacterium]
MKPVPKIIYYLLLGVLVLWFPLVPLLALDAPTQVNDGTGSDIDYSTNTSSYSANWTQIDWSSADPDPIDGDRLVFEISLQWWNGASWQTIDGTQERNESIYPTLPSTVFQNAYTLTENRNYRNIINSKVEYLVNRGTLAAPSYPPDEASPEKVTNGFLVDSINPTASIDALSSIQTENPFLVEWSGDDSGGSGVESYTVQYSRDQSAWNTWYSGTSRTQGYFDGRNGARYYFRVQATDKAGNVSLYSSTVSTILNVAGAGAGLSASPSTLQFQEGETQKPVDLNIQATGAGSINITSISVQKTFPDSSTSTEPVESVNISLSGGGSTTISRTLSLSSFDRALALGGSQSGSLTVRFRIQGSDAYGNPVEATAAIPVTVSAALPSDLQITGVEVELPPSPYYAGDQIEDARVVIQATGSGQVTGQILIDDESDWTEENTFSVSVDGQTNFDIEGQIPTDDPGEHTVKAEISSPVEMSGEATYTISDQTPPFPPDTLTLVEDVAELSDFDGEAEVTSQPSAGYQEFTFNGTAKMKLLSLKDTEIEEVTVTDLKVQYSNDSPTVPKIKGGTVEKEAEEEETFVTVADNYLKVKKVSFDGQDTSKILVDAKLTLPKLDNKEIMDVEGLVVKTGGVDGKNFSYPESDPKSFTAFGMEFGIHDVNVPKNALIVAEDEANDRYSFTMSGSIKMESKKGTSTKKDTLTSFQNLTIYSDGEIDGTITFSESFDLIPDKLSLTEIKLESEGDDWKLKLKGKLKNLPEPLDVANNTAFTVSFDKDGNASGGVEAIKELKKDKKGHKLGGDDDSEYDLGIGTLDLTYLAVVFKYEDGVFDKDFSEVKLGVDFYLDVQGENGEESSDDEKRITFGELNANGDFEGGVRLNMEGDFDWHSPTNAQVLQNKQLVLPGLNLTMEAIAVQSEPFGIAITGSIVMGMDGVSGGINFQNLILTVDGTVSNLSDAIEGGQFEVADLMQVEVGDVDWSTSPTDLSFESNETTGEGANQAPQKGSKVVAVQNYLRITDASVTVGDTDNPSMSGGFDEFTFYDPVDGGRSFVLRRAQLETVDIEIMADVEYSAQLLRLAGTMTIPGDTIEAAVVGKFGRQDGQFTMGVFVAATGLNMTVAPGVFLDGIGGGVFVNPVEADIELVRSIAGFKRPELDGEISANRSEDAENPGGFALMLMGDFYVGNDNMLSGRALLTITANYFTLDAEASYAADTVEGVGYLTIGWDPGYAEGNIELKLDYFSIFKGEGNLSFYVYDSETWGVAGEYNLYMYDPDYGEISTGELFIGPPGLMVRMDVTQGMDLKVVSGKIVFEGMFWCWQQPASSKFGLYASVTAQGEILKIASGKAKLEGALIAQPSLFIYAVGSVRLKVRGVTLFKGSMWVTADLGGFDGGRNTKSQYDQMIEDARNMADAMASAKDELMEDLQAAQMELMQLSPEQLAAAGIALVEADSSVFAAWEQVYQNKEIKHWPGALPPALDLIRSNLFGPNAEQMASERSQLQAAQAEISARLEQLNQLQSNVIDNFENYEDLVLEDLPSVADLGQGGSPFGGFTTETVTVNGQSKTVKVGFDLDISKAEQQVQSLVSIREDFAAYQEAFIEQSGRIDAKLRSMDRILYNDQYNLSELNEAYTEQYQRINSYLQDYIEHQIEQKEYAQAKFDAITSGVEALKPSAQPFEPYIQGLSEQVIGQFSQTELAAWIEDREFILQHLISSGGEDPANVIQELDQVSPEDRFAERGLTLWWKIPVLGFTALQENCDERLAALDSVFGQNMRAFRQTWSQSSVLVDQIYSRKGQLYALLNEMYDQLARYGNGDIAVLGGGNAAGFEGHSASGLGFRTGAAAASISAQAVSVSAAADSSADRYESASLQTISAGTTAGFVGDTGSSSSGRLMGKSGTAFSGATADTAVNSGVDSSNWRWVSVISYFSAKRDEIEPYIENPVFQSYTGMLSSSNEYSAVVTADFLAEHPVEVVEYSWSLQPHTAQEEEFEQAPFVVQPGEIETSTDFLLEQGSDMPSVSRSSGDSSQSSGGLLGALFGTPLLTNMSIQFYVPWFSLGSFSDLEDTLLAANFDPQVYALTIKARGAGGTSSIRQGRIDLDYFDPQSDTSAYESALDSSDATPPSTPEVDLQFTYTARADQIYASWQSGDSESGIQRYEYAVVPYSEVADTSVRTLQTGPSLFGALGNIGPATNPQDSGSYSEPFPDLDWRDAGSLTEMNIRGLSLEHGQEYALRIRATNGVGRMSVGTSEPFIVDLTPPAEAPIAAFEQRTIDRHPNSFELEIGPSEDPESGIAACQFALGSSPGGQNLFEWTPVASDPQFSENRTIKVADLPVQQDLSVYLTVRSVNRAGIASDSSQAVTVQYSDSTPPQAVSIALLPQRYSIDTSYMQIGWAASQDPESGIVSYEYGIGTSPNSPDFKWWTMVSRAEEPYIIGSSPGLTTEVERSFGEKGQKGEKDESSFGSGQEFLYRRLAEQGELESAYKLEPENLQLEHGQDYYVLVRVSNGVGLSSVSTAGPLTIDTTPPEELSLAVLSVDQDQGTFEAELNAADPESGIKAYRRGGAWIAVSGQGGTPSSVSLRLTLPIPTQPTLTSYQPAVQVQVMNGAGLTAAAQLEAME